MPKGDPAGYLPSVKAARGKKTKKGKAKKGGNPMKKAIPR